MTTTNTTCRMAITDRASSDGSPSKKRSRISSADGTSMDDESIENRWTRKRSVCHSSVWRWRTFRRTTRGKRDGKNAVARVMIDTGARMLIKLPGEMRLRFFLQAWNVQLMRERKRSLYKIFWDSIITRRKIKMNWNKRGVSRSTVSLELLIPSTLLGSNI